MPRLIVQGTKPAAVQYGVRMWCFHEHPDKFRGKGRRATKRRQVMQAAVSGCLEYQASIVGRQQIAFCAAHPDRTEVRLGGDDRLDIGRKLRAELTAAAWQSVRASIGGFLLTWLAGWIVSLVVDLLLEWFLSSESEGFRATVAKGEA